MSGIQLVAVDLDGTLVQGSSHVAPRDWDAVQALVERRVQVVIITGRMHCSAAAIAAQLHLPGGTPIVSYNGALVRVWPAGRTWLHQPLPVSVARRAAAWSEERDHHIQAYLDDRLYVPRPGGPADAYSRHAGVPYTAVGPLSHWLGEPPTKLLLIAPPGQAPVLGGELAGALGASARVVGSLGDYIEITAPEVAKATALDRVCRRLRVKREAVLTIGDSWNDIDMLRWAGHSVAMAHAPADVRAAAATVSSSVAEGLQSYGLIA